MEYTNRTILLVSVAAFAWLLGIQRGLSATNEEASSGRQVSARDPGWPREITRNGARLVYYQPQVDEWNDLRELRARLAFVLTPSSGRPAVGVEEVQGNTHADLEHRTVLIDNIKILGVRFPSLSGADEAKMQDLLTTTFPGRPLTVSLDRLIAAVQAGDEKGKTVDVKSDPPSIFVSTEPGVLLTVPGDPVLAPIKGLQLKLVVNANWDLFFAPAESRYYLLMDKTWLMTSSLSGSWSVASKLPADLKNLPSEKNWDDVIKAVAAWSGSTRKVPNVFFSTEPAELIEFAGDPIYKKIPGTQLSYVTNTDSWVFADSGDNQIYYLVAGRWFRAASLKGPWSYAGNDLPKDFQEIPAGGELGPVLASVPGTPEAKDAVLLAQVPTTAVVKRAGAEAQAKVQYDGDPQFVPIEGTALSYAANADADVIKVEGTFFLCLNAVWFSSPAPTGPWTIVTEVPAAIYTIPPNSPVYHVTYVKIEGSNQDEVTCSYTAGYGGAYIAAGAAGAALVWGTGYYYPPYVYNGGAIPVYRPYYATYGVAAGYYPYAGVYAVGGYAYGPYASAGRAAWYNPQTGGYGRAYTSQSPNGGRTYAWGYNPSTGTAWTTQQGHGYYGQWGTSTVTRGGETYQAGHVTTNYGSTGVVKGPDNLYAGHDGNVYKRDDNGNWSKWDNGGWQPVNKQSSQGTLSSQNNRNGNVGNSNSKGNQGTLGSANPSTGNDRSNAKSEKGGGTSGTGSEPRSTASDTKSKQTGRQQSADSSRGNRSTDSGAKREGSTDQTNRLEQEASARQRGSQNANLQQRSQQRGSDRFEGSGGERTSRGAGRTGRRRD